MATMFDGSARTTPRVRAELQKSKEKTSTLAQRYGLSRTTLTQVVLPHHHCRCTHGSVKAQKLSVLPCRGGSHRGVPAKNAFAARRVELTHRRRVLGQSGY